MGEGRDGNQSVTDKLDLIKEDKRPETEGLVSGAAGCGVRHSLSLWVFLGFANLFVLRVDMSIALVAMATHNSSTSAANASDQPGAFNVSECQDGDATTTATKATAEFDWSNSLQGFVLSAFYYGYFVTQIPGGLIARRVGGKHLFSLAMAGGSALALLTPVSARLHVAALIAVRVLQGGLQGIVFPAVQVILSRWAPAKERSRLVAFSFAGCQAGTVLGMLSAGYLCDTSMGWPIVFYIEGVLGLVWCVGWVVFTSDSPSQHPRITESERRYIEGSADRPQQKEPPTPWVSILTSPAFYAIAAAHFANDWGCFAIMTCLPKFMKDILFFDLTQNGVLSSLPYIVTWVCNFIAGTLADCLRKPNRLRTVHVRKLMVCVGLLGPASLLLAAAYLPGCGRVAVVVLLTVAMGFSGFTVAGHSVNHLDIAPPFAGIMFAMTNTFGTTAGFIGPALAGALTNQHDTRHNWQTFFLISAAVYACGGLLFLLLASGDLQPWAKVKDTDRESIIPAPKYGSVQADPEE